MPTGMDFPPTQMYILLAVTLTGWSIAASLRKEFTQDERSHWASKLMLPLGGSSLLLSWLHVSGWVSFCAYQYLKRGAWGDGADLVIHLLVLIVLFGFASTFAVMMANPMKRVSIKVTATAHGQLLKAEK